MTAPLLTQLEAERYRLHSLSQRQPLTDRQADRLAHLDFLAAKRGFALYRSWAGQRALTLSVKPRRQKNFA